MSQSTPDTRNDPTEPERPNPGEGNDQTAPAAEGDTAPTQTSGPGQSASTGRIDDDQLPEDLQPNDDNPLAKPLDEDDDKDSGMSLGPDGP
ncbi:MAG: hypothetical protein QOK15_2279 [Nocardioidaceae bacterium]|nr:hypothetical protein [Nocardioidaceae bacterium]